MNQELTAPPEPVTLASLVEEVDLGSGRGSRKKAEELEISVARLLTEADLPAILNPPALPTTSRPTLKSLRPSHHKLAQLVAEGKSGPEISLLTGYATAYLSTLKDDPAFAELVDYYLSQQKEIFIDAQQRLRLIGMDAADKLHEHLNDPTKVWSHRELMDVIKLTMPAETTAKAPAAAKLEVDSAGGVIEIKFVGAPPPESAKTLEGECVDISPER